MDPTEVVAALVARLRAAKRESDRAAVREEMLALARGADGVRVREALEAAIKEELLEVQWEIEEVLEATAPKKAVAEPAPPPKKDDASKNETKGDPRQVSASDLVLMYDDPRGLMLHRTKDEKRWFATQVDPRTGQPQTFELHPDEVPQIKTQLAGSPYWLLGG